MNHDWSVYRELRADLTPNEIYRYARVCVKASVEQCVQVLQEVLDWDWDLAQAQEVSQQQEEGLANAERHRNLSPEKRQAQPRRD